MTARISVILDANAIIYACLQHIDLENAIPSSLGAYTIFVPGSVTEELSRLGEKSPDARLALAYSRKFKSIRTTLPGDDGVIEAASPPGSVIVTSDRELIRRTRGLGIGILTIRGGRTLDMIRAPITSVRT